MKIAGFTIARNVVKNDYPIEEAIQSILPIVDVMIVLAGDSEDNTNEVLQNIQSPKMKIFHSVWDRSVALGGSIYAVETNKAFRFIDDGYDWAFYIQADEVVHEKYHNTIIEACKKYKDDKRVEGLLFKYLHFYGTYDYVGDSRSWYNYEIRIIRNDKSISSYKDAQGFRKGDQKLKVKPVDAYIYHYGWVKSPEKMQQVKELYKLPDRFFLSVGSIIPRKNLLTICKVYYELKDSMTIPLIVIGRGGKYKEEVKQYVAEKGLDDRIIFLNDEPHVQQLGRFKSGEDFPAIYQQALCMIYPSVFEGFGLPILEALQSGCPVITSNVSCLPETGGDAAYYVDPLSVQEMATAIETIATNGQLRKDMIERGYKHAAFFSQERRAERVMELYRSMM